MSLLIMILYILGDTKCPGSFSKSGVFCYLVVGLRTYTQQVSYCASIGGYLAKIGSSEENSAVSDYVSGNPGM